MMNPKDKAANQAREAVKGSVETNDQKTASAFATAQKMMNAGWEMATPMGVKTGNGEPQAVVVLGCMFEDLPPGVTIRTWDWQGDDPQFEISFFSGETVGEMFFGPRKSLTVHLKENGEIVGPKEAVRLLKAAGY